MNGVYWGLTALCLMGRKDALPRDEMIEWVMNCWDEEVGESIHAPSKLGPGLCRLK